MNEVPVFNNTNTALWVGGQMVPPGETRLLPAHHVPAHLHPAAPAAAPPPPPVDPLTELLAGNVKDVVAALPDLDAEQLMELEGLEGLREAPRKGVLEAVAVALLQRAADAPGSQGTADAPGSQGTADAPGSQGTGDAPGSQGTGDGD